MITLKTLMKPLYSIDLKRYNTGDVKREKEGEKRWLIYSTMFWQVFGFLLLVLIHVGENKDGRVGSNVIKLRRISDKKLIGRVQSNRMLSAR